MIPPGPSSEFTRWRIVVGLPFCPVAAVDAPQDLEQAGPADEPVRERARHVVGRAEQERWDPAATRRRARPRRSRGGSPPPKGGRGPCGRACGCRPRRPSPPRGRAWAPRRVHADLEEGRRRVRAAEERQDGAADPARPVVEGDRDLPDRRPAAIERKARRRSQALPRPPSTADAPGVGSASGTQAGGAGRRRPSSFGRLASRGSRVRHTRGRSGDRGERDQDDCPPGPVSF